MPRRTLEVWARDGRRVHVAEYTPSVPVAPDAPTVVLAHGWTLDHHSWEPVIAALHRVRPVRVVAYDQPGHGRSGPAGAKPTVHALGEVLGSVVDAVAPTGPLVLGGHSMGGMTVMAYAGERPREVADRVRGVLLASTTARLSRHLGPRGAHPVMRVCAALPGAVPAFPVPRAAYRWLLFGDHPDPVDVRAATRLMNHTRARAVGQFYLAFDGHDEVASLAALAAVPTTVVVGTRDRLTPVRWSRRLADAVPGADLVVVPGKGHLLTWEATDLLARTLAALVASA